MTTYEISAIVGYYRMGADWEWIAETMKISAHYVKQIVKSYLETKNQFFR